MTAHHSPEPSATAPPTRDVRYLVPGPMHLTELGAQELDRRERILQRWAMPGTHVTVHAVDSGPASIESMYEEYLSIPAMARLTSDAEAEGADAAIVGCFGDPGLDGLREISDMLVVGPAAASIALATTLGHRFGIVTITGSIVPALRRLVWEAGALDALATIRHIDATVIGLNQDHEAGVARMLEQGRAAVEQDGADVLVLGCMSMGFLDVAEMMTAELGVPVINPSRAALHMAETTLALGLSHSRRAFARPPKMTAGAKLSELHLGTTP
jgi:allantoin racemase